MCPFDLFEKNETNHQLHAKNKVIHIPHSIPIRV